MITNRDKVQVQKQKQTVKCHLSANGTPFKAQVHTFCPKLKLLVGPLSHREAYLTHGAEEGAPRATGALKRMHAMRTLTAQGQDEAAC